MIEVTVKFFAVTRDLTGIDEIALSVPKNLIPALFLDHLFMKYPQLKEWKHHLCVAVNCDYVAPNYVIQNGDEVAIIPPVSGG